MTNDTKALEVVHKGEYELGLETIARIKAREEASSKKAIDEAIAPYAAKLAAAEEMCDRLAEALLDAQAGLTYIRSHHGELYGVGFERCETNSLEALTAYTAHKEGR